MQLIAVYRPQKHGETGLRCVVCSWRHAAGRCVWARSKTSLSQLPSDRCSREAVRSVHRRPAYFAPAGRMTEQTVVYLWSEKRGGPSWRCSTYKVRGPSPTTKSGGGPEFGPPPRAPWNLRLWDQKRLSYRRGTARRSISVEKAGISTAN